ncbi:ATP synthase subunit I [Arenicella xantha]|uniref:F0F1-type ATP synthase assembly protein I n=1 Tax=Arenicella xantha TaxID=644221 RepID=A0A395JQY5_9GAMM|nr:ATP synthase subunit I [Arenicella xantha]RBP53783.1 F0F1-type ATP synthase assembly protein I [Arenicella xantha]
MNNSGPSDDQLKRRVVESKSRPDLIAKLALAQLAATLVVSLLFWAFVDTPSSISALFGGLVVALANFYMAARMRVKSNTQEASQMLARFYASVILKVLFTLAMMVIFIIFIKVSIAPFIITYLLVAVAINMLFLLVPTNDVVVREDH